MLRRDLSPLLTSSSLGSCLKILYLLLCWLAVGAACSSSSRFVGTIPTENIADVSCGGIFRIGQGSINFTFNELTLPDPAVVNKTCLWQILPDPFRTRFSISINRFDLREGSDRLALTTFVEYHNYLKSFFRVSETVKSLDLRGAIFYVVLLSNRPEIGKGFQLTWDNSVFPSTAHRPSPTERVSLHEAYTAPLHGLPGQGQGQGQGNWTVDLPSAPALSTFAITKENQTDGSTLRVRFSQLQLYNNSRTCVESRSWNKCPVLVIAEIQDDGVLYIELFWPWEKPEGMTVMSNFGFVFIFWGYEFHNATLPWSGGSDRIMMNWDTFISPQPILPDYYYYGDPPEFLIEYKLRYEFARKPLYTQYCPSNPWCGR